MSLTHPMFPFPMKPQRILNDVRKVMGREDIVISDVGAHKMWIARHYNCYEPNTCIISNGFATMESPCREPSARNWFIRKRRFWQCAEMADL